MFFAVVIIFSVIARTSLALVTVVSILPFSSRKVTIALSIASLWLEVLPRGVFWFLASNFTPYPCFVKCIRILN